MNQIEVGAMRALRPGVPDVRAPSLSAQLWNIRWSEVLPFQFDEVRVEIGPFSEAAPFIAEHYAAIFGNEDPSVKFLHEPMTDAKRRFSEMSDVFLFRAEQRTVGIMIAHPTDWSTYYMRSSAFVREYRSRHMLNRFLTSVCEPLAAVGVKRLETEISPSNLPANRLVTACGWMVTGTSNSERWGTVLRYTKFLTDDAKSAFAHQFCVTPR